MRRFICVFEYTHNEMKYYKFLPLLIWQCASSQDVYEKFVTLKQQGNSKYFNCAVYPVDDDTDLSHYEISGIALQEGVEKGIVKVASEKRGTRLQYDIPLEPNKNIRLSDIYLSKNNFQEGKPCRFRLCFEDVPVEPRFILKNGALQPCSPEEKIAVKSEGKIVVSIFVKYCGGGKEQKTSAEVHVDK